METAQFGQEAKFDFPSAGSYPEVATFDRRVEAVPIEEMARLGEEMIDAVTGHTPGILCESEIAKAVVTTSLINSRGGQASHKTTVFSMGLDGNLIRGTDMLFVWEGESDCHPIMQSKTISSAVIKQLELAKTIALVPSRPLPVIFTPSGVASTLLPPLMSAFNGKMVLEGASPVAKRVGERIFDASFSLWDDATLSYRPSSRPCDDEGVTSQRTALVEQGRVAHFLYDLQTAGLANTRSTGNGIRRNGLPAPSAAALVIATGKLSYDNMVKDMKEGVIVEHLLGAGQGNVLGGDFSGNVLLGYKVENGKVVGRIKNAIISGNVYQLLKQVNGIGSESRWVGSMVNCPHLYCPSVSIAAKG